ncbi:DUF551 domain-containing protein, partial [Salmonella enterica]|nr:DUF551 domain-containing protein [Salmonella enterica]
ADSNVMLPAEEAAELARIVLAALTAEPVFYIEVEGDDWTQAGRIPGSTFDFSNLPDGINKLYAAPPAPVIPDDWVMVPKEPTQAMIKAWLSEVANFRGHAAGYKAALAAAPQQEVK